MATAFPIFEPKAASEHTHLNEGPSANKNNRISMPRPLTSKQRDTGNPWISNRQLGDRRPPVVTISIEPMDRSGEQLMCVMDVFDSSAKRNSSFRHPVTLNGP